MIRTVKYKETKIDSDIQRGREREREREERGRERFPITMPDSLGRQK